MRQAGFYGQAGRLWTVFRRDYPTGSAGAALLIAPMNPFKNNDSCYGVWVIP
jgi:hypothetical protein